MQRLKVITQLHQHGLVSYEAFAGKLHDLAAAKGFTLLAPPHDSAKPGSESADAPAESPASVEETHSDEKTGLLAGDELAEGDGTETAPAPAVSAPAILAPLRDSLHQLSNSLQAPPLANSSASSVTTTSASTSLSTSLSTLSTFITTQNSASSSMAYRPYIGYNSTGTPAIGQGLSQDQLELKEIITGLKAEIRTVKGALLNRRNFATLPARGEAVAA